MTLQKIDISGYWNVVILYNVDLGKRDSGFTHTDFQKKRSIVGISFSSSREQMFNTLVHELKHVQSHICSYYNIAEDSEPAAYLIGYLAQKTYKYIRKYL